MEYKTELHCHTKEFSPCSNTPGEEAVEKYIANGYTTLVITNHIKKGFHGIDDNKELWHRFFEVADIAREAAGNRLNVITGAEVSFVQNGNDYLVYGITEQMMADCPDVFELGPAGFREKFKDQGAVIIQAHPFRYGQVMTDPRWVDGIEVFNGHFGWCSHNYLAHVWASTWAEKYNRDFILTSGSDHHYQNQKPVGGIITEEEIKTAEDLVRTLRSHNYARLTASLGGSDI